MELVGEEKKIRARFSELRLADEQANPGFAAVLSRAQTRKAQPALAFNCAFVAATVLLVCALVSLAWWSSRRQRTQQLDASVVPLPILNTAPTVKGAEPVVNTSPEKYRRSNGKPRLIKVAARRQMELLAANRLATRKALAISNWQSPTSVLLDSPNDEILTSLPQFKREAEELKSFLPNR